MAVFSGDVSKLARTTEGQWTDDAADVGRLPGYVERLESFYAESHWEPAAHPLCARPCAARACCGG